MLALLLLCAPYTTLIQTGDFAHRYIPADALPQRPPAAMLDLIMYSREQIRKENDATGAPTPDDHPWGIVSIKVVSPLIVL